MIGIIGQVKTELFFVQRNVVIKVLKDITLAKKWTRPLSGIRKIKRGDEMDLNELINTLNNHKGKTISLDIASIVNKVPLSNIQLYSQIKMAFIPRFPGAYEVESGFPGNYITEETKGALINLEGNTQLFIDSAAKIKIRDLEKLIVIEVKDKRSSMYVQMQVFKNT